MITTAADNHIAVLAAVTQENVNMQHTFFLGKVHTNFH